MGHPLEYRWINVLAKLLAQHFFNTPMIAVITLRSVSRIFAFLAHAQSARFLFIYGYKIPLNIADKFIKYTTN